MLIAEKTTRRKGAVAELGSKALSAFDAFTRDNGRPPTQTQLSDVLHVSRHQARNAIDYLIRNNALQKTQNTFAPWEITKQGRAAVRKLKIAA